MLAPINPAPHARSSSCAWVRAASRLLRRGLIAALHPWRSEGVGTKGVPDSTLASGAGRTKGCYG